MLANNTMIHNWNSVLFDNHILDFDIDYNFTRSSKILVNICMTKIKPLSNKITLETL